jgi:hypothetical protein
MSATTRELPKSYLTEEEIRECPNDNLRYLSEALAANIADDMDTSWQWLALADLPAYSLMSCKKTLGADFVREKGFNTAEADAVYGPGWLDAP